MNKIIDVKRDNGLAGHLYIQWIEALQHKPG